jgi:putative ABC transport system permease protein
VVTILQGAIGMFAGILSSDSQMIVFERDVSDLFFSNVPSAAVATISAWPMVAHADPVVFGIVSSAGHPIITCFGVTPADARIHKAVWLAGDRAAFGLNSDDVVLGERSAQFLGVTIGERVPIGHAVFRVIGILKTANGFEDGGVFMPLGSAQSFFHKEGSSSVITIKLKNKDDVKFFKSMVKANFTNLIALEDAEFNRSYSQFRILKATAWAVGACGLLLGGLGVANTMIMSVFTRIREIAILRVNGFSHLQLGGMILGESAVVSLIGATSGLLIGICILFALKQVPALDGYIDPTIHPFILLFVILLALLTGIAGAFYPAIYAMRVHAVEALRFE